MVKPAHIQKHMRLVTKDGESYYVDRVEEDRIKLARDEAGHPHWIPVLWTVAIVDGVVRLAKSDDEVRAEWDSEPEVVEPAPS